MVNSILNGFFNIVITLVSVLTYPIDQVINSTLPQFNDVLSLFGNFLSYILGFIPWVLSWFHIPSTVLSFVIYYIIGKIIISSAVHVIKIALAWWRTIIP